MRGLSDHAEAHIARFDLRTNNASYVGFVLTVDGITKRFVIHFERDVLELRQTTQGPDFEFVFTAEGDECLDWHELPCY